VAANAALDWRRMSLPPDSQRLRVDHLPTPFSAAEIRAACGPGRRNRFRVTDEAGSREVTWWFEDGDDEGATIVRTVSDGATPERHRAAWIDLQRHASYPESSTSLLRGSATTAAGVFEGWVYERRVTDSEIEKSWFARDLPGPPVLQVTLRNGAEVYRSELIDFEEG
jgi:hypothetical protein